MARITIQPSLSTKNVLNVQFDKMTREIRRAGAVVAREQAELVVDEMRHLSPVLTGAMRDDIGVKTTVNNNREIALTVGPHNTYYAKFVEFGTVNMRAQPFMRVAIEVTRRFVEKAISDGIREAIK